MNCTAIIPQGAGRSACINDQPTNLFFFKHGFTFSNFEDVKNMATWRDAIRVNGDVYPTLPMQNVATTKPAETKETDGAGVEVTTGLSAGGAVVNLKVSSCDFKQILKSMAGGMYSVAIGLGGNKIMFLGNDFGELTGFTGQCTAIPVGIPGKDAKLEEFQVSINWQSVEEWKNYKIVEMPVSLNTLTEMTLEGLDVDIKTALTGTAMEVVIKKRCINEPETEVVEWVTTETSVKSETVTATSTGNGDYTLVVEKGATPEALVFGDYIKGYFVVKELTEVIRVSEIITIRVK